MSDHALQFGIDRAKTHLANGDFNVAVVALETAVHIAERSTPCLATSALPQLLSVSLSSASPAAGSDGASIVRSRFSWVLLTGTVPKGPSGRVDYAWPRPLCHWVDGGAA